ncbi:MAG: DUF5752 family protein [Candidatus Bathyarchaeia archaeon]
MNEEQLRVLKTLNEATSRMDLNMFAQKVNLSPNQTIKQMQELVKKGFLRKVGSGFGITEKGKAVLKAMVPVPDEMAFHFYFGIDQPADFTALTLEEFCRVIKEVKVDSLEFHLYRGDFENWLKEVMKDQELVAEIGGIKAAGLKGEDLRKELLKVLDAKYGIKELL